MNIIDWTTFFGSFLRRLSSFYLISLHAAILCSHIYLVVSVVLLQRDSEESLEFWGYGGLPRGVSRGSWTREIIEWVILWYLIM